MLYIQTKGSERDKSLGNQIWGWGVHFKFLGATTRGQTSGTLGDKQNRRENSSEEVEKSERCGVPSRLKHSRLTRNSLRDDEKMWDNYFGQ